MNYTEILKEAVFAPGKLKDLLEKLGPTELAARLGSGEAKDLRNWQRMVKGRRPNYRSQPIADVDRMIKSTGKSVDFGKYVDRVSDIERETMKSPESIAMRKAQGLGDWLRRSMKL